MYGRYSAVGIRGSEGFLGSLLRNSIGSDMALRSRVSSFSGAFIRLARSIFRPVNSGRSSAQGIASKSPSIVSFGRCSSRRTSAGAIRRRYRRLCRCSADRHQHRAKSKCRSRCAPRQRNGGPLRKDTARSARIRLHITMPFLACDRQVFLQAVHPASGPEGTTCYQAFMISYRNR